MLGIELNNASHKRIDHKTRDRLIDEFFAAGKLPIVHVPEQHTYNVQEIHVILDKAMSAT